MSSNNQFTKTETDDLLKGFDERLTRIETALGIVSPAAVGVINLDECSEDFQKAVIGAAFTEGDPEGLGPAETWPTVDAPNVVASGPANLSMTVFSSDRFLSDGSKHLLQRFADVEPMEGGNNQ